MIRKLLIVFASGVALCVVAFALAYVTGGNDLRSALRGETEFAWTLGEEYKGPKKSRDFTVDGGQTLTMEVPVELHFSRGPESKMVVSGPAEAVDRLVFENGRLSLKGDGRLRHGLDVTIVAPQIAALDMEAPGDVTLSGMQQDQFRLKSEGAIDLDADGKVRQVWVKAEGASDLDLDKLEVEDATVRVDGAGSVSIAATGFVDVEVNGVGNVTLHKKPAKLRSSINGVGSIDHDYN
ncbi:DUF2807 domain-containing protein [Novosphingobium sp. PC22D]|uniref:GIN domain-containing protein n=1 Tax=Novosphingobium sp. PC22D TaxID=1962403 RepID=UPI000BEF8131|nr:DUF2807 domain-containing protein [Novosphingobium sp. PC22D]PEQ12160.1 DUF2807 domain-containing protein [Novosphingobium sp. PC22D]